ATPGGGIVEEPIEQGPPAGVAELATIDPFPGESPDPVLERSSGHDGIDETDPLRTPCRDRPAGNDHLDRLPEPDEARQPGRPAKARDDPKPDLRESDPRLGPIGREPVRTGERQLGAATHARTV